MRYDLGLDHPNPAPLTVTIGRAATVRAVLLWFTTPDDNAALAQLSMLPPPLSLQLRSLKPSIFLCFS